MSLAKKTLDGLKWSYVFTVLNVIAQLGLTVILARILTPNDYGLVAMANVVLRFGAYFAQMGIGQSLIQRNEIDKKNVFTACILTLILSLAFYLIIFLLAPLSHYLFANSEVINILRVSSISLVFSSIATIPISLLRMKYKYRLLGVIDFIAYIVGNGAVGICMALAGFGVWSLVVAVIVQGVIQLSLAFYFTKEYYGLSKIDFNSAKKFLSYGSKHAVSTFIEVITYSTDYIIVGHYFKESVLGIYNRASLLVQLPSQYISANLVKVLFPTLNEVKSDKNRFVKYYQLVNYLLGLVLFAVCIFISVNAEEIVSVLLGPKWAEAAPILRIIAVAVPFNLLINYNGLIYDVYAHLNQKILIKIFHMVVMVSLFFILKSKGLAGIAYAYLISEVLFYFVYCAISHYLLNINISSIIKSNLPFLYIIIATLIISLLIKSGVNYFNLSNGIRLAIEVTATPLLFALVVFLYTPKTVRSTINEVLPVSILAQNKYFNYLMKIKIFRKYWSANWNLSELATQTNSTGFNKS